MSDSQAPARRALYVLSFTSAVLGTVIMSMTPVTVTLALRISAIDPVHKNDVFAWAIGIGYLAQLLVAPLSGLLSDATTLQWGMRKPWIVGGTVGALGSALVIAQVNSVPATLLAWAVMSIFMAALMTPLFAVISDQFPVRQHGLVSGLCGATPLIGILAGSWLVDALPPSAISQFVVPTLLGALLVLQFVVVLKDKLLVAGPSSGIKLAMFVRSYHFRPAANPSFTWFLIVVVLIYVGAMTLQDYMVYLLQDAVKVPSTELSHWTFLAFLVANGVGCLFSVIGGWVSDRLGRRKPVYALGTAFLAVGLVVQGISHGIHIFIVGTFAAGLGYGLLNGLTWALAVESSGDLENAARDMGHVNVALVIPGLIVPLIATVTDTEHGYLGMYLASAVLALLAIPAMVKVKKVR